MKNYGMYIDIHVDNGSELVNGTHLQGYITASYEKLCELFGDHYNGDGYKTDAEWNIISKKTDGSNVVATIYNWKDGFNYLKEDGMALQEIQDWHIGGYNKQSVDLVKTLLSNNVNISKETK